MIKTILWIVPFICLNVIAQEQKLSTEEIKSFRQQVEKETKTLKSIRTDFVQKKHMSFLSNDIESKGKMYLNAAGVLKWEYTSPNKYSVIFKDNVILINDNGKKNTVSTDQKMFKKINHLISGSLSGRLFDDKEFSISYFKSGNYIVVKLLPNDKTLKKYIQKVHLYFPKNKGTVAKVKMVEPSGDYTFIVFKNKELNVKIDPRIFSH